MVKRSPSRKGDSRPHDPVYRRIFSNRRMVEDVLRRFLEGAWIESLDFDTLEPVQSRFVSRFLEPRESDIIWRLRYGPSEGEWFYVYVLMEIQSSVFRFMALRMWVYMGLLYQFLHKQKMLTPQDLLPPILPLVLYNGEEPWWAPRSLGELLQTVDGLTPPSFEYQVLDVSHYPREELRPVEGVASSVFLMEQADSFEELQRVVDEMRPLVADTELEEDLALLVSSVTGKLGRQGGEITRVKTLREVGDMLAERVAKWPQRWLEEGLQKGLEKGLLKGRQEGRQEGLRLGKVELLQSQAEHRFGELPSWARERLERADVDTLDRWSRRLLDAARLEDVFD